MVPLAPWARIAGLHHAPGEDNLQIRMVQQPYRRKSQLGDGHGSVIKEPRTCNTGDRHTWDLALGRCSSGLGELPKKTHDHATLVAMGHSVTGGETSSHLGTDVGAFGVLISALGAAADVRLVSGAYEAYDARCRREVSSLLHVQ